MVATKKAKSKKSTVKIPKHVSFRRTKDNLPFLTYKFTDQTLYWFILSTVVLVLSLWVINLHLEVQRIYNQIDANEAQISELDDRLLKY